MYHHHVSQKFGLRSKQYDKHANLQKHVAKQLAYFFPQPHNNTNFRILEIGCGTGLLTEHLIHFYPNAHLTITDLSPHMLDICQKKYRNCHNTIMFKTLNAEQDHLHNVYDLIVSSMSLQWCLNPLSTIKKYYHLLNPNGYFLYATLGNKCFSQWKNAANELQLKTGTMPTPNWPNIVKEEIIPQIYPSALTFFQSFRMIGANQPHDGYIPMTSPQLKKLCNLIDAKYRSTIDWHIVYGALKHDT